MPTKLRKEDGFEEINKSVLDALETPRAEPKNEQIENKTEVIETTTTPQQAKEADSSIQKLRKKRKFSIGRFVSLTVIAICLLSLSVGGVFVYNILAAASETTGGGNGGIFETLQNSFNPKGFERVELKGETEGRTNVLVLGADAAAGLTDTIMLISYYHKEQKIATMSIPRDFYVTDGWGTYRVNAIYPFAENREPGSGPQAVSDFVSREVGVPIHYWALVNFDGVGQIVNAVGGIDINVTVPFTDYEYPTSDYSGYLRPAPSFKTGVQHMDGFTALVYARSRHGDNGTGSDFDRGRRQAEVGEAILQKMKTRIDSGEIMNINTINSLLASARDNVKTSMNINELMSFYEVFKEASAKQENIMDNYFSINWYSGNGFLCSPPLEKYGASVVTYCDGAIGGTSAYSAGREKARAMAQNLLEQAKYGELNRSSVIILANRSDKTGGVEAKMKTLPVGTVWAADNYYRYIPQAGGSEKINIYIADETIRKQFEEVSAGKLDFEFTLQGALPAEKTLTANNQGAEIIVWIE